MIYLQFPKTLEGPALQLIHHRVLSLDAAAQAILNLQAAAEAAALPHQASVMLGAVPQTKLPKAAVVLWLSQVWQCRSSCSSVACRPRDRLNCIAPLRGMPFPHSRDEVLHGGQHGGSRKLPPQVRSPWCVEAV